MDDTNWYPAIVPGTIHTDLLYNHLIPDPYFGDNEKKLQWIDTTDWEYQSTFEITQQEFLKDHVELHFKGLDTYAKVYLNDSLIIQADNMFRSWSADIKQIAKIGKNKLTIVFGSPTKRGQEEAKKLPYTLPGEEKVFTRKAQYQYGWDWGPRLVTCGIWKDVQLISWRLGSSAEAWSPRFDRGRKIRHIAELYQRSICVIVCNVLVCAWICFPALPCAGEACNTSLTNANPQRWIRVAQCDR